MKEFFEANKNCSAGFPTSNLMAELISKDFDVELKANLSKYGVIYFERYVDDGFIILNSFFLLNFIFQIFLVYISILIFLIILTYGIIKLGEWLNEIYY